MIIGKAISPFALRKRNGGGGNDPDAQLFITATGISGTNATATNQLVLDLKAGGVWNKGKAFYPMVGGTSTTCKFNLKDARDLDAAYRLTFFGGGTFSANGYQPNGTNSYGNTFLQPLVQNNTHLSYYSRTNAIGGGDIGNWSSYVAGNPAYLVIKASSGNTAFRLNATGTESNVARADSRGFAVINRRLSTTQSLFFNNVKNDFTITSTGVPTGNVTIGAVNFGTFDYGNKQCAFASIGDGLTDAEALAFYNAVQLFNTTLGRQV